MSDQCKYCICKQKKSGTFLKNFLVWPSDWHCFYERKEWEQNAQHCQKYEYDEHWNDDF